MISKKEKRKIKVKSKDDDNVNTADKYLAYVIKPKKSKLAMESTCVASTSDLDTKMKKEKKKNNSSNRKTSNDSLANSTVDQATGIELITPKATMEPVDEYGNVIPMNYTVPKKCPYEIEYKNDKFDYDMKPVVIEAHLKKPTSYYIPRVLRDEKPKKKKPNGSKSFQNKLASMNKKITDKANETSDTNGEESYTDIEIVNTKPMFHKVQPTQTSTIRANFGSESNDKSNTAENSNTEHNGISNVEHDPNMSNALNEFYKEVTKEFENHANQLSNTGKMSKKKSDLTVDKSVADKTNLANVVSGDTSQLENIFSKFPQTNAKFFSLENKVILVLCPKAQFSILGKLKVQVLYGAIALYGSILNSQNTSEPVQIYSPRGYSSICISVCDTKGIYNKGALWDVLTSEGVDRSLKTKLNDTIQQCKKGWSVLLLENFENTLTNFLNSYSSFKLFPKIDKMKYSWYNPKRAEYVLQTYFQFTTSTDEITIWPYWNVNLTEHLLKQWQLTKSMTIMVTGGKGVGKSTTARYLINNLLSQSKKVVLLDLDIGQAEMTPAGAVSLNIIEEPLFGPNFTHLKMPYYQLYLEEVNVANCMTRYIESAKKLVECLKNEKDLQQYPVVVNTMGFCKGIGLDICIFLMKLIQPSNVVQIMSKRPKNNFDFALIKQTINDYKTSSISLGDLNVIFEKSCDYELHSVSTMAEGKRQFETWNMEPRQQRELVLLSYLSQIISNADDNNFCYFTSNSINNIVPYTLSFSSFYITLIKANISPTHMLAAMNGNIVALCGADLNDEISEEDKEALNYPMVVIKPPLCTCYGYGIVRGIDMKRREVYINTPLKKSVLRHVNLLAGCTSVPFTLLHRDAPYAGDKGELPTSREPRRGNFRVDQNRNA